MQTPITASIVDVEETRQITAICDDDTGKFVELKPVDGSEQAFLHLQLPGGQVLRTEVAHMEFGDNIVPLLAHTPLAVELGRQPQRPGQQKTESFMLFRLWNR